MAAALFRGGTGSCLRCIHRELCRVVWRPQTALFSSKPSDRKQPRRTHIKKAKPQPAVDVAKLLEQLFSQHRPGTAPPAGKARPTKTSSIPTTPPASSSMKGSASNAPPSLKTEPAVSVFPTASSSKQLDSVPQKTTSTLTAPLSPQPNSASPTNPKTPQQSPLDFSQDFAADSVSNVTVDPISTTPASLGSGAAAIEWQTSAETIETIVETATKPVELMVEKNIEMQSFSAAVVEPVIETTTEPPVEPSLSLVETRKVRAVVLEGPVEPTVDASAAEVQNKGTDSRVVVFSHTAKDESLIETTIDSPVQASHFPMETLETQAAFLEGPVEPMIDAAVDIAAETKSTNSGVVDIPHTATVEPLLETAVEPLVGASTSPLDTPENRDAVVEGSVETTIETKADTAAQAVQTNITGGVVNVSHSAKEEPLIETTVEPAAEASTSPLETKAAVGEGTVEPTRENEVADSLSHTSLIQKAQQYATLKNEVESTLESTVELSSGNVTTEEGVSKSEQMTLESVTLHVDKVLIESLRMDELLRTKFTLDEKAEKQFQQLFVQKQTGAEYKSSAETEISSEDEGEILTKALSKWHSLPEDLKELEGESGTIVEELLCHGPAVLSKTPGTVKISSASDLTVGANGESLHMKEKGTEAEAMTLESITLSIVKAEVGGLETEVLLETRNALEKEAEELTKEETMEVKTMIEDVAVFEDTTEAEILTLDSISEATDALEAETSVILEAMFGSEQGPRQPTDTLLVDQKPGQQDEGIDQEAETESGEQKGSVLEAMTLESVTLAEVEASLGTLQSESLSETTDYLEKEAEILAGEKRMEVEDGVASEEATEDDSLSLPEGEALSEALQTDALMEELLFSIPGHVIGVTEGSIGQEVVRVNILDDVDSAAAVTDGFTPSPALKEVLLGQEVEEEGAQTEALGTEEAKGTHTDLDPVQSLFLEKIREYKNMRRLNEGLLEAEPDYEKYLSEETAKLQRLYGGGDLSSFPEFTFTEPKMDQDSK